MKVKSNNGVRYVLVLVLFSAVFIIFNLYYSYNSLRYEEFNLASEPSNVDVSLEVANLRKEVSDLKRSLRNSTTNYQDSNFKNIRVYCMVPTMFSDKKFESWAVILRTWGKRCDILKFFVDPIYEEDYQFLSRETVNSLIYYQKQYNLTNKTRTEVYLGDDLVTRTRVEIPRTFTDKESGIQAEIVQIDMKRLNDKGDEKHCWSGGRKESNGDLVYVQCKHIWEKVWRSWVYMHDTGLEQADYFFKVDDDTFFFPDFVKLHAWEHKWHPDEEHYFGHHLHHGRVQTGFIAGAVVGYSRGTLRKVVPSYKVMPREYGDRSKYEHGRCVDRDGATQELAESKCLSDAGIVAEDTRDINGFEKVSLHGVGDVLLMRKKPDTSYWFWIKKEASAICCSTIPIAFHHYKTPKKMLRIYNLFFNQDYDFLMEFFADYKNTKFVESDGSAPAKKILNTDKMPTGGTALARYEEIQYILRVREMLELFDLYN